MNTIQSFHIVLDIWLLPRGYQRVAKSGNFWQSTVFAQCGLQGMTKEPGHTKNSKCLPAWQSSELTGVTSWAEKEGNESDTSSFRELGSSASNTDSTRSSAISNTCICRRCLSSSFLHYWIDHQILTYDRVSISLFQQKPLNTVLRHGTRSNETCTHDIRAAYLGSVDDAAFEFTSS